MGNNNHLGFGSSLVIFSLIGCVFVEMVMGQIGEGVILGDDQGLTCDNAAVCGSELCICESDYCCIERCCLCQCEGFEQCQDGCWNVGAGTNEEQIYNRGRLGINRYDNREEEEK